MPGAVAAREALVAMSLRYLAGLSADAQGDQELLLDVIDHYIRIAEIQGVPTSPSLGKLDDAEVTLATADALVEGVLAGGTNPVRGLDMSGTIRTYRTIVADSQRRDADAHHHLDGAIARMDALLAHPDVTPKQRGGTVSLYPNLALAANNLHRYDDGVRLARRFLELARDPAPPAAAVANGQSILANALRLRGDLEQAQVAIREAQSTLGSGADLPTQLLRYGPLLREGLILGEDGGVSLERPDEAVVPLREAFTVMNARAQADPNDATSGGRAATAARELGDILRWRQPAEALEVYDEGLQRVAARTDNVSAKRASAELLAGSTYALRRLGRTSEAANRLDRALALLTATKDHPANVIPLDGPLLGVLRAHADHDAENGKTAEAVRQYRELVDGVMRGTPNVEQDLTFANRLAGLYDALAAAERQAGALDAAAETHAMRQALWEHWARRLPGNEFVARRLQAPVQLGR